MGTHVHPCHPPLVGNRGWASDKWGRKQSNCPHSNTIKVQELSLIDHLATLHVWNHLFLQTWYYKIHTIQCNCTWNTGPKHLGAATEASNWHYRKNGSTETSKHISHGKLFLWASKAKEKMEFCPSISHMPTDLTPNPVWFLFMWKYAEMETVCMSPPPPQIYEQGLYKNSQ